MAVWQELKSSITLPKGTSGSSIFSETNGRYVYHAAFNGNWESLKFFITRFDSTKDKYERLPDIDSYSSWGLQTITYSIWGNGAEIYVYISGMRLFDTSTQAGEELFIYTESKKTWEKIGSLAPKKTDIISFSLSPGKPWETPVDEIREYHRAFDFSFVYNNKIYIINNNLRTKYRTFETTTISDFRERYYHCAKDITVYDIATKTTTEYINILKTGNNITKTHSVALKNNFAYISRGGLDFERLDCNTMSSTILPKALALSNRDMIFKENELITYSFKSRLISAYNTYTDAWRTIETIENTTQADIEGFAYYGKYMYLNINDTTGNYLRYEVPNTQIGNPSPTAGFVNEQEGNTFSWELITIPEGQAQKSAIFQWRVANSATINNINVASQQNATVPPNTFPNGSIQWRVQATSASNLVSDWSEWFTLTTVDTIHQVPIDLIPSSGRYNGTENRLLSWVTRSTLGTPQKAFEIQVNYNQSTPSWQSFSGVRTTKDWNYITGANTLKPDTTGFVQWRVRTYNSDMAASPWSSPATITVLTAPNPPAWVSVEAHKSRPLCKWTSQVGQTAWQLQILLGNRVIYDTTEKQGMDKEHKINEYLERGSYTFKIRYKTEINMWSSYSDRTVVITAYSRVRVQLDGELVPNGGKLFLTSKEVTAGG